MDLAGDWVSTPEEVEQVGHARHPIRTAFCARRKRTGTAGVLCKWPPASNSWACFCLTYKKWTCEDHRLQLRPVLSAWLYVARLLPNTEQIYSERTRERVLETLLLCHFGKRRFEGPTDLHVVIRGANRLTEAINAREPYYEFSYEP